jgi:hypothetical protein
MRRETFAADFKLIDIKALPMVGDESGVAEFSGYASTFGNVDRCGDVMAKGCFGAIDPKSILMLWNHSTSDLIGGYSEMREDDFGLFVKGEVNLGVQRGKEAAALLKAGHLNKMSIGFNIPPGGADWADSGVRTIKNANLLEVSLVPIPANTRASVLNVKSGELPTIREFERLCIDAGLSADDAKAIISKGYRAFQTDRLSERDAREIAEQAERDAAANRAKIGSIKALLAEFSKAL